MTKTKEENIEKEKIGADKINGENGSKKEEEPKSLFGGVPKLTGGLFGDLSKSDSKDESDNKEKPKLFQTGSNNLFSGSSLFNTGSTSLLDSLKSSSSLFSSNNKIDFNSLATKPLFTQLKPENKKGSDDEDDEEGADELFESNSPKHSYNPTLEHNVKKQIEKDDFTKKYVKEIENLFVYTKSSNKYVSKGKGYLSLEHAEIDGKKISVVLFR
jgi:hypothetical protein